MPGIIIESMNSPQHRRENLYAVLLCLALIAVIIMTADAAPLWIYQGF